MRFAFFAALGCLLSFTAFAAHIVNLDVHPIAPPENVWLEEMTWPEVKAALLAGKTTVIIPTGGTEQNGPHLALGKHNFILQYTAMTIAQRLGNAVVAPIMEYVPEGDMTPPTGHMRFPGTVSLRPETFAAVLEDAARSYKQHGFKYICFVGEHGASQPVQQAVAEKLDAEWKAQGVRVLHVSNYYDAHNGQDEWAKSMNIKEPDIEAHGGFADTAEMLAAHPQGVREKLIAPHTAADMDTTGAAGSGVAATRMYGAGLIELKVKAGVEQIRAFTAAAH